jgi:hypothetical protein
MWLDEHGTPCDGSVVRDILTDVPSRDFIDKGLISGVAPARPMRSRRVHISTLLDIPLSDEEILEHLLELNHERAGPNGYHDAANSNGKWRSS